MCRLLVLLCSLLLVACARNVPVNADLSDEQVEALSGERTASLEITVDNPDNPFFASPNQDCAGTPILIRNSVVTERIHAILTNREYPSALGRIVNTYPEIARVMECYDAPDGLFTDVDILSVDRLAPGDYTLYHLMTIVTTATACQITEIPVSIKEGENKFVFSEHLEDRTEIYGFSVRACRL